MVMDELPRDLFPVVQVIDDWNTCRKLGLVFETRTGGGKLLVCAIDLAGDLDGRPVARQLRHSLLAYMASDQFSPQIEVEIEKLHGLFRPPTALQKLGATIRTSSQQNGYEAENAIDGDPKTIWHTNWNDTQSSHPHEIVIDLKTPQTIRGLTCLPRQDMSNGRIADYAVHVSRDGDAWGQPVAQGRWIEGPQQRSTRFPQSVTAQYVKLIALSEVHGRRYASAAEIDLLLD
jgi:hypothetical protein